MDATTDRLLVLKGDGLVRGPRPWLGPRGHRACNHPPGHAAQLLTLRARPAPLLPRPQVRLFDSSYSDYLELLDSERAAVAAAASSEAAPAAPAAAPAPAAAAAAGNGAPPKAGKGGGAKGGGAAKQQQAAAPAGKGGGGSKAAGKKRTLGIFERQELERLDKEIADLGKHRDRLNEVLVELASSGGGLAEVEKASLELAEVDAKEQALSERWLELAEIAGDI
jgi:hypothetical protein